MDNQSILKTALKEETTQRTKHIAVRMAYIREQMATGQFTLEYVNTDDNLADIFTKSLGKQKVTKLRQQLLQNDAGV